MKQLLKDDKGNKKPPAGPAGTRNTGTGEKSTQDTGDVYNINSEAPKV